MGAARTAARVALWVFVGVAALGLVALSPLLIWPLLHAHTDADWRRLGAVGDTYGGVAAIVSGVALLGVAGSLVLQRRQSRIEREYAFREYHREMLRMSMDDPALAACWGPQRDTGLAVDVHFYVTLMIGYWHAGWLVGAFNEQRLRLSLRTFFAGDIGRRSWREHDSQRMIGRSRRSRRFFRMVEQEYRTAVAAGPPVTVLPRVRTTRPTTAPQRNERTLPAATGPDTAAATADTGAATQPVRRGGPAGRTLATGVGALVVGAAIGWWIRERGGRRGARP
ncbi:DUF6082 family protein [Actinocatenispora sera]|uniref:DUF6082 family protein n=1 Tax=Actinocatenispora sera TaxID=390989 RepID=UPI0033D61612